MLKLKSGDVVTDLDSDSQFFEKQGEVINVQFCFWDPPEVLVRFDRKLSPFYLADDECPNGLYFIYQVDELRIDKDWEPEVYARRIFKDKWHHVKAIQAELNLEKLCMVNDCPHKQSKVTWIDIWGLVINAYVCEEHDREFKRWCYMDSFPWRKSSKAMPA